MRRKTLHLVGLMAFLVVVTVMTVSTKAASRGETFTYSVTLNGTYFEQSGSIAISYDKSALTLTEANLLVGQGAFNMDKGQAVFMSMGGAIPVSGTIATFSLRVNDNAPFSSYPISVTVTMKSGAKEALSLGTISVVCNHSYGAWTKVDDNTHSHTCSICSATETVAHTWNAGTVTKQATCAETGIKTYNCTVCNAAKTETIPKTTTHTWGAWTKADDNQHKHTCTVCSTSENAAHTWNGGTVTKEATCKESGTKTYTCTACNATKTETIQKTTNHTWGNWAKVDDNQHKRVCSVCNQEETASHGWNSGTVTKQATCAETGVKTYMCSTCNATKTEDIPKTTTHTFGAWEKLSDTEHKRTCTVCHTASETKSHTWDSGKVTKQATCAATGVKTFTCTVCKATKTEDIAKTTTHTWGRWEKVNDTEHKRTCTVCNTATETAGHTWNTGVVTKQATCAETGVKTFTCTACSATKTEDVAKTTTHTWGNWTKADADQHKRTCSVCGKEEMANHSYGSDWQKDASNHYHVCSVCGDKKDSAAHTPGAAATETAPQTCTTCGYIIAPALGHTHNWSTTWTTDENGHWHTCSGCNEKKDASAHVFDNDCDTDCNACGFTRTIEHQFELKHDETSHWQECKVCGETKDKETHVAGPEATEENAQVCLVCGYEIASKLEPPTTEPETEDETESGEAPSEGDNQGETKEGTEPTEENTPGKNGTENGANAGSPLPWILGGIGLATVAAFLIFFLLKKKKKEEK